MAKDDRGQKKPLYRKVNTKARGVHHHSGGHARWTRNTKAAARDEGNRGSMYGKVRRGLDYTPLFQFLISKVGQDWDTVHAEAVARLDRPDPIFTVVALHTHQQRDAVRTGESTWFSGLYVNEANRLAKVAPDLTVETMEPTCPCCTHTFNGVPFVRTYDPEKPLAQFEKAGS